MRCAARSSSSSTHRMDVWVCLRGKPCLVAPCEATPLSRVDRPKCQPSRARVPLRGSRRCARTSSGASLSSCRIWGASSAEATNRLAKLKGQTIEEYRPDLTLNESGAGPSSGGFFDEEEARPDPSCSDPRFSAAQTLQLVMAERMTEEREKAITQVAESVGELAEIFKEIQVLVIDQGTILDRIDYNIEQAADRVGNAVVELNKANEYQKKSRTMLCIYILLLLCGFMVIVLILKKTALS